jgi:hypothetical protein
LGNIRQVSNLIFPQVKTVKNEVTDEIWIEIALIVSKTDL